MCFLGDLNHGNDDKVGGEALEEVVGVWPKKENFYIGLPGLHAGTNRELNINFDIYKGSYLGLGKHSSDYNGTCTCTIWK